MQSHDAEYRESGEGWARTPTPAAMTVPLSDARMTVRDEILAALSAAGAFCGECGFQPGETGCADCVRVREMYADALMPIVDRLRAELEERRVELRDRRTEDLNLRGLLAPDGLPRRVPMELGASLVPAVDRLLLELDRFRDGHRTLFALMQDGQHWDGQRLVSEALLSQRDIRRALHWPAPVAPDGRCECKATANGVPVHPTADAAPSV